MKYSLTTALAAIALAHPVSALADDTSQSLPQWAERQVYQTLDWLGANGEFDPSKGIDWGVIPGPVYSPEKQFGIGVSAVGLFRTDRHDELTQPSSITVKGFGSSNGSVGLELDLQTFFDQDNFRFNLNTEFTDAPDVFYGAGIDSGRNDSNQIDYDRSGFTLAPRALWKVLPDTFVGIGWDLKYSDASNLDPKSTASNDAGFGSHSFSSGAAVQLLHDTRDFSLNASKGRLLEMDFTLFDRALGADKDFRKLVLNYSEYLPIDATAATLAWQVQSELHSGDVPWDQLAILGGSRRLRGYEEGRYRGEQFLMGQVEYRQPLWGRHGMVTWAGIGTLSEEIEDLGKEKWLHSLGVGYRFAIKPRVNLRLDAGFGNGEKGMYFSVNEVF